MRRLGSAGFLLLVLALMMVLGGCGNDEDPATNGTNTSADAGDVTTTGRDDATDPAQPTPLPEPTPEGELPPIQVTSPAQFANLYRSFVLAGTASVFEGTLRWAILDAKLKPMISGTTTATCGGPCRGKFRVRVPIANVPVGSWELHVWQPPVADDDPERVHDVMVPITVTATRVTDAPPPGTMPPGGEPPNSGSPPP